MLQIQPSTSIERKLLFLETLLNTTDKVSKVADNSVLSGVAGGVAKVSGKAEKDIILAVSQLFPDSAFGTQLDQVAANFGISPRYGAQGSSTYVRVTGDVGTTYLASTHFPTSTTGIRFEFEEDFTIGSFGFAYVKVRSIDQGSNTNVPQLSISKLAPQPSGHQNIINEVAAEWGRDIESDELLRIRIKDGANILARGTMAMLEQAFIKVNNKVLKIFNQGQNAAGKIVIAIATQNGQALTQTELDEILTKCAEFFNLTENRPFGTNFYGIQLTNITIQPVDVAFRVDLDSSANPDDVRQAIQVNMSKYLDFRFFDTSRQKVEWDVLLQIAKNVKGVKYIPDQYFYPRTDLNIDINRLPRLRGFLMLDLNGQIISNFTGTLSPVYYPNVIDASYMSTVLPNV